MLSRESIQGPAGQLETIISTPEGWQAGDPMAVCCHPHPLHGGTMQNKVVHILEKTFNQLGARSVRFNFRGVGKSQGQFDAGEGEGDDLRAITNWMRSHSPASPLWLAGFSFGAFVALRMHEALQPQRLLVVAPPVDMYPQLKTIHVVTKDWILVQGEQDEVVSAHAVKDWAQSQPHQPGLLWHDAAGHFFHGKLTWLQQQVVSLWTS